MAQPSTRGIRALRTATSVPLSPAPIASWLLSQIQHRRFSSRPSVHSLVAQRTRPRQPLVVCRPSYCRPTQTQHRSFHFAALATATVDAAEATIAQLHAVTHLPWYLTIPLVALGVNLVVRLPFSLHARALAQKRSRLSPLLLAWGTLDSKAVVKERRQQMREQRLSDATTVDTSVASLQAEVFKRHRKTVSRVYGAFGVQQWKLYGNFLALPPWLVIIEAIRRMCGAPVGLLGMVFRSGGTGSSSSVGAAADGAATTAAAAASASAENVDVATVASAASSTSSTATDSIAALAEPTFTTGGSLWFPDLTAADPYHILPFALSAMLVVNVLPGTDAGRRALFGLAPHSAAPSQGSGLGSKPVATGTMVGRVLQRSLLLLSISVSFLTLHFPAAIHLYWLASAASTYLITHSMKLFLPIPNSTARLSTVEDVPWIRPRPPSTPTPPEKTSKQ